MACAVAWAWRPSLLTSSCAWAMPPARCWPRPRTAWRPTVLIGKDTRISGYMLEAALEAGFAAAGVDVWLAGPMPTPAVAYLTRALRLSAGVVISASHNPYHDNGIKFFSARATSCRTRSSRHRGRAGAAHGVRASEKLGKAPPVGRGRPLHRILQEHLPQRHGPARHAPGGGLRPRRGLQHRAARVPRAGCRSHRHRQPARWPQHQRGLRRHAPKPWWRRCANTAPTSASRWTAMPTA
jgi:hypothetical protein